MFHAARSRLCNKDSARAGVFIRNVDHQTGKHQSLLKDIVCFFLKVKPFSFIRRMNVRGKKSCQILNIYNAYTSTCKIPLTTSKKCVYSA